MSKIEQIEEMANIIALKAFEQAHLIDGDENLADIVATDLYEKGYRKVDEDYAKQCTCYALGCQMAKQLEQKVAREIFADLDKALGELAMKYSDEGFNEYFGVCEVVFTKVLYPIKKKYVGKDTTNAESEKDNVN